MSQENVVVIDAVLLDKTSSAARTSARLRRNHNFHPTDDFPSHRLLNAIEPGSYVAPHRHLDPLKDETMLLLRGRLGLVVFDDVGTVLHVIVLSMAGGQYGVDIPHGCWHSVLALEPNTVFFEAKAGPYVPLIAEERATWAPLEDDVSAPAYQAQLCALFGDD